MECHPTVQINQFKMKATNKLLLLAFLLSRASGDHECVFESFDKVPPDCVVFIKKPLVINAKTSRSVLTEKLAKTKSIKAGLVVEDTLIEDFDLLPAVTEISNPYGAGALFKRNSKLKRIQFKLLSKISGTPNSLEFDNDHFPVATFDSKESMADLQRIEFASSGATGVCREGFLKITRQPRVVKEGWSTLSTVFSVFCGFVLVFDISLAIYVVKWKWCKGLSNEGGRVGDRRNARRQMMEQKIQDERNKEKPKIR